MRGDDRRGPLRRGAADAVRRGHHDVEAGHRCPPGEHRPGRPRRTQGRPPPAPRARRPVMTGTAARAAIRTARSVVVKVGTTALTTPTGMFDAGRLAGLAEALEARMKAGSDVIIAS